MIRGIMTSIAKPDYWSLLGIPPGSSDQDIKRAFRKEARKWHPDLNVNDVHAEERFKLVNEAYAVLSDIRRRTEWEKGQQLDSLTQEIFKDGFPSFEEYIHEILGIESEHEYLEDEVDDEEQKEIEWPISSPQPPPPVPISDDLETIVELSPEQGLYGTTVELEISSGTFVEIETPPFAGDGWRLRLEGVAEGGRDHFVQLRIQTEEGLRVDGLRIFYRLELLPPEAVLGCAVKIPTLDGPVTLQVPPRSSSGRLLRLRGRGMEFEDLRGDQLVEVFVVIPAELSPSEEALYQRLQELSLEEEFN